MLSASLEYRIISSNYQRSIDRVANEGQVKVATDYYKANIGKVTSIDQFLGDYRLYSYAMKAYGLEDMTYAKGFMKKVLTEGTASPTAFANKLNDQRYRDFADAFNFSILGTGATQTAGAQAKAVTNYYQQTMEQEVGDENTGSRLALYFARKGSEISNWYDVLADPALLQVVQTALGLSSSSSQAPLEAQVKTLNDKFNIKDFANPAKLDNFVKRFTAIYDATQTDPAASSAALTILSSNPVSY